MIDFYVKLQNSVAETAPLQATATIIITSEFSTEFVCFEYF